MIRSFCRRFKTGALGLQPSSSFPASKPVRLFPTSKPVKLFPTFIPYKAPSIHHPRFLEERIKMLNLSVRGYSIQPPEDDTLNPKDKPKVPAKPLNPPNQDDLSREISDKPINPLNPQDDSAREESDKSKDNPEEKLSDFVKVIGTLLFFVVTKAPWLNPLFAPALNIGSRYKSDAVELLTGIKAEKSQAYKTKTACFEYAKLLEPYYRTVWIAMVLGLALTVITYLFGPTWDALRFVFSGENQSSTSEETKVLMMKEVERIFLEKMECGFDKIDNRVTKVEDNVHVLQSILYKPWKLFKYWSGYDKF